MNYNVYSSNKIRKNFKLNKEIINFFNKNGKYLFNLPSPRLLAIWKDTFFISDDWKIEKYNITSFLEFQFDQTRNEIALISSTKWFIYNLLVLELLFNSSKYPMVNYETTIIFSTYDENKNIEVEKHYNFIGLNIELIYNTFLIFMYTDTYNLNLKDGFLGDYNVNYTIYIKINNVLGDEEIHIDHLRNYFIGL